MKSAWIGSQNDAVIAQADAALRASDATLSVTVASCLPGSLPGSVPGSLPSPPALPGAPLDLLLLDTALPEADLARVLTAIKQAPAAPPIIFISTEDSLDARLKAARAGGTAFYRLPLDFARFGETVRELLRLPDEQPYRALLIDDDPAILAIFRHHLTAAGFEVYASADPRRGYDEAGAFAPDVVFLDISMPAINGLELLTVFRQHEGFTGTQVVLVSGDASLPAQLDAMSHGAQNYLTKPVRPQDLVQSALNNAVRARSIRNLLSRDALTGLLNHARIYDLAGHEFARHQRSGAEFSVAVMDLDHFKKINDQHGHPAGDAALKYFAGQLLGAVRRTDFAGRMGGDEFMLLLPDTGHHAAQMLLEKLRAVPMQITFNNVTIPLSFSCGVAGSHGRSSPAAIISAADAALYEVKRSGRARVALG